MLLDHGLYFDLDRELRINYSKFWLSLIASSSPTTAADRRKYAKLVGNIDAELVPCFPREVSSGDADTLFSTLSLKPP